MIPSPSLRWHVHFQQVYRFGVIGLISNAILYIGYLALTALGLGPKFSASLLFAAGVTLSYVLNSRWTFMHHQAGRRTYYRYWAAYGAAYILNISMLALLVDRMKFEHRIVQGVLVLVIALMLFLLQKYWVFKKRNDASSRSAPVGIG